MSGRVLEDLERAAPANPLRVMVVRAEAEPMPVTRIEVMRLPAVLRRTGLSRSTLYSRVKAGQFPRPISLGTPHAVGWIDAEVDSWLEAQQRARYPQLVAS